MASPSPSPPLGIRPPAPERLGPDLDYASMTRTHPSAKVAAAVSPSRDVIFEILSWLPAKSLGRCRCVSKEWRALISNPAFVAALRSHAEPRLVVLSGSEYRRTLQLLDTDGTVVRVVKDLAEVQRQWNCKLQAIHGDLACISSGYDQSGAMVVDLATGKTLLACFKPARDVVAGLGMHYLCYGFGRAAQSGSLNVFRLGISKHRFDTQICEVITLGDDAKWRQTNLPPTTLPRPYSYTSIVAVNGALYFLSEDKGNVLSFDLDTENWKVIHGPRGVKEAITIAGLSGALCMVQKLHGVINIWLLDDFDKNIWKKTYTMPAVGFVVPLRVSRFGGELLFYCYDYIGKPLLQVYDPRSGKCTNVKTPTDLMGKIIPCGSNGVLDCVDSPTS